jgi:hypothetical protein
MWSAVRYSFNTRLAALAAEPKSARRIALLAALHLAALGLLIWSEREVAAAVAFVLSWGLLNCLWLMVLRRPLTAAALSLAMIVVLMLLSHFKHRILMMTVTFVDVMIIDVDTFSFLLTMIPGLAWKVALAVALAGPALVLLWRLEPFRVRRGLAVLGAVLSFAALAALSFALPIDREDEFYDHNYVSKFARSGAVAAVDLMTRGVLEADAAIPDGLRLANAAPCEVAGKLPHIVMVFDESSFDVTALPGVEVPPNYQDHFRSFDGKQRSFVVEGAAGPSWYTEYNVLAGLSVRSYGRFAESVTRIAAGRVNRGLPYALRRCGYKTFSLYSWMGAFVGARSFQTTTGIEHFLDAKDLGTRSAEPDRFFYDYAARLIAREGGERPLFIFVYLSANHFPWHIRYRPDLMPDWQDLGNWFDIDEYLRRQTMSAQDYALFRERLGREFPEQSFFMVRFGDHQPHFARFFLEPRLDQAAVARRIQQFDPRYFTTYYAVDAVNFRPVDTSSALDTLDAPHLPLVVLEGAGVPLDSSFLEQKKILQRCRGMFYLCAGGAEARRFNRLLMDAGLLKGF